MKKEKERKMKIKLNIDKIVKYQKTIILWFYEILEKENNNIRKVFNILLLKNAPSILKLE